MKLLSTTFILFLFNASLVFAQDENCELNVNCELIEQLLPQLEVMQASIKKRYNNLEEKRSLAEFEKDIENYLTFHQKVAGCPGVQEKCPSFSFNQYLDDNKSISSLHEYESYGPHCKLRTPTVQYRNSSNDNIAMQIGTSVQITMRANCQDGKSIGFIAYKEGLLVKADNKESRFDSQTIARRITFNSSEVKIASSDGKNLRISWDAKNKNNWIDIDPVTKTFKDSNFIQVAQLNSDSCEVEKLEKPARICAKNRKALLKRGSIKSASEYECIEYVPVIKGVSSRVSRG